MNNYKKLFNEIEEYKIDIDNILGYIDDKVNILNNLHDDFLKKTSSLDQELKISLDTLRFQTKLISMEKQNYTRIYKIFLNLMFD